MTHVNDKKRSLIIKDEILELERRLEDAKVRLNAAQHEESGVLDPDRAIVKDPVGRSAQHFLLLLADSALPLGSFAFSSGLESYIAHSRTSTCFPDFLNLSLLSYASTTLPFVLAAHRSPQDLIYLDGRLDATIMCTVGRRSSVAQGRALLSIWDRSLSYAIPQGPSGAAFKALKTFSNLFRSTSSSASAVGEDLAAVSSHLGPLFGALAVLLGLSLDQTAYVFMLNHVKAVLSSAVRASIFGPYQAQKLLASREVRFSIEQAIRRVEEMNVDDAGQCIPIMDLWLGRHEILYSRIFNS